MATASNVEQLTPGVLGFVRAYLRQIQRGLEIGERDESQRLAVQVAQAIAQSEKDRDKQDRLCSELSHFVSGRQGDPGSAPSEAVQGLLGRMGQPSASTPPPAGDPSPQPVSEPPRPSEDRPPPAPAEEPPAPAQDEPKRAPVKEPPAPADEEPAPVREPEPADERDQREPVREPAAETTSAAVSEPASSAAPAVEEPTSGETAAIAEPAGDEPAEASASSSDSVPAVGDKPEGSRRRRSRG